MCEPTGSISNSVFREDSVDCTNLAKGENLCTGGILGEELLKFIFLAPQMMPQRYVEGRVGI